MGLTNTTKQVYGHEKVSVINGGLPRAKKEGVKLEIGPPAAFKVGHTGIKDCGNAQTNMIALASTGDDLSDSRSSARRCCRYNTPWHRLV